MVAVDYATALRLEWIDHASTLESQYWKVGPSGTVVSLCTGFIACESGFPNYLYEKAFPVKLLQAFSENTIYQISTRETTYSLSLWCPGEILQGFQSCQYLEWLLLISARTIIAGSTL